MTDTYYNKTKYACFLTSVCGAVAANISPLLFLTFRQQYGISYSLLGFLVVLNFGTQLLFDLILSFFSHRINLALTVRLTPAVMGVGLLFLAAAPVVFSANPYIGITIATILFSAGGGMNEVLTSPVIAAIPSKDPDKQMSKLHSCYAWGLVFTVAFSTGFFVLFGTRNWQYLVLLLTLLPLFATILFFASPIPPMKTEEQASGVVRLLFTPTTILYFFCIFLGGAAECTMSQWCSGYLESSFGISKTIGDLCGVALFGATLGFGRSLYTKFGRNIHTVLFAGSLGAAVCYVTAAFSENAIVGLVACALTGFCVSMLWPGTLIAVTERMPNAGVALFALMAVGGDLGASLCPQAVGLITDAVIANEAAADMASSLGITAEQFGMKAGMAFASLVPIAATILFFFARRSARKNLG